MKLAERSHPAKRKYKLQKVDAIKNPPFERIFTFIQRLVPSEYYPDLAAVIGKI